ncbi:MAG: putative transport system permease protein [Blastocatellia bacterium]|jgi:putative ABC transport system permease protein|nr:putative transport system permease protein [Blastocatellia bacterium]
MNKLLQDLRYAVRTMRKRPSFTLIAVMTLALGIGGSTAIFTVVDAGLLRGLPYKSADRLYHIWESTPQKEFPQREFSYPDYQDYQKNQSFEEIAAYTGGGGILSGRGEPERVFAPLASANFFKVLGVEAVVGRLFQPGDDKQRGARVVVLTYGMWQRRFGGDPNVIGQGMTINGDGYEVIGVLPANFQFALRTADVWRPYQPSDAQLTRRFMHGTNLIGRLKPGVNPAQAQAELAVIAKRIEAENQQSHAGTGVKLVPLQEQFVGQVRPILLVLLAAVGFVLLIACANVASLLLTRSLSRQKEVAIRAALGANRWRVVRQLLTESILLSLVGGAAGVLIAYWGVDALVATLPDAQLNALPFLKSLRIDSSILMFSLGLSLLTGIVFGLAPAIQSSRPDLNEVLKEGGRSSAGGARHRLRSVLVTTEIALAVVLLVGAGLMMKSLLRLLQSNIGFNPQNVLTMTIAVPSSKYDDAIKQNDFFDRLQDRVQSLPGVAGAGTVNVLPLQGGNTTRFIVEGDPVPPPGQETEANIRVVSERYFAALGIPMLAGRPFDARDGAAAAAAAAAAANARNTNNAASTTNAAVNNTPGVVIIGKSAADKIFGSRDPVGRKLIYPAIQGPPDVIIGVVSDVKIGGLDEAIRPVLYYPFRRFPGAGTNLLVRTTTDPTNLAGAIRNETRTLEPDVALFNMLPMEQVIGNSPAAFLRRFPAMLIGIFAVVALLLASIGIYGVVSYSVSQQTHYIGVRMALGAQTSDIVKMVLRQGLSLALAGIAIGVVAAFGLMRLLRSLLFEVQATDIPTFAVVVGTLLVVALLACYIPARRATKVDPLLALRYE